MRCIKFIWRLTSSEDSQLCNKESSTSKNTYSVVLFITYPDLKCATCLIYPRFIHNNHVCLYDFFGKFYQGIARTQSPTNKNYAAKLPTFVAIVGVSQFEVQWISLTLGEPPWWSWLTPMPGKYALTVSRGNISQISSGWALLSKIKISGLAAGIVKILSSSKGRKQPL